MPIVSVIIPTYKHHDYILQTLDSVFAQIFTDYEIIVVNDGSPDNTGEVLRPLAESGQVRYIEQANAGQAAARNRGLAEARGKFIAFLDDDDLWPEDKLEWQVGILSTDRDAVVVYGQMQEFGESANAYHPFPAGAAPESHIFDDLLVDSWIRSPGQTLISADSIKAIGGLDVSIWGTDDWDLWLSLAKRGKFRYVQRVALRYRCHSANASRQFYKMYRNASKVVLKHLGSWAWLVDRKRWRASNGFVRRFASEDGWREIQRLLDAGEDKSALASIWHLMLIRPAYVGREKRYKTVTRLIGRMFVSGLRRWVHHGAIRRQ